MKLCAPSLLFRNTAIVLTGWFALGAILGAAACKKADFASPDGSASTADGSRRDGTADLPADLPPGNTCPPDMVSQSKGKAEACSCDRECQTGFCVDGVCCSSACGETCKACNLPSSPGDCAFVPAGGKPNDPQVCAASTPATCGQDGTCDGKGGCRKYVKGTECKAGTCDGDTLKDILTCDGQGQCTQSTSRPCPPYGCDPNTSRCATSCATDDDCAEGRQCVAQRCGKSSNGASCGSDGDCSSGFCVDGICCNIACSGACVSCDQTGSVGHCTFVGEGLPDPACVAFDRTTCGQTGLCDGNGNCTLYPANTVCGTSSCSGLLENTPRTCDGQGTCRDSQLVDCAPFLCTNGACETSCDPNGTDVCAPGIVCVAPPASDARLGSCGKRQQGQPCQVDDDCNSGICADYICCDSRCDGPCRSCALWGSPGQCTNVAAGAADPHKSCVDLGREACATDGVCDGQGACRSYPAGTECGPQSCVAGAYSPPSTCNTAGQCVASRSRTCSPFQCNGDVCFNACTNNDQCTAGSFCINGSCGLKPQGADCSAGSECQSGFCAQGVCCDGACTDACMACNLIATAGHCTAVADRSPDPQGKCAVTGGFTCGTTGTCLKGACAYYGAGLGCKAALCASASAVTPTSTCDGQGSCVTPANQSCGTFACVAGACKSSCTVVTEAQDCVPPNTCVNGSCGLKVNGAPCTGASQCASGFCTEGICCDTLCSDAPTGGLCKTCKGTTGSPAGTCADVAAGGADPKSRCVKSNAAAGDCANDGTCNGAGACRSWSSTTGCRQESCAGSSHTLPANCDGKGGCPTATVVSCGSYVCSSSSPTCLNTCASNADCTNGLTCLMTNNRCGDKLPAGDACVANGDCDTGLVCGSERVCCDQACANGCQSCKLAGKAGVCSNVTSGGTPRATTPVTCPAASAGLCGASGYCDGSGACEQRSSCAVNNTVCPADLHTRYNAAGVCSAQGACTPQTTNCATGYLCIAGGSCATSCSLANAGTNCDTANGYTCIVSSGGTGACAKRPNSTQCAAPKECASGNCVDGYCCDSACSTTCMSCNLTGHLGVCWNVPANTADGACVGTCPTPKQASGLCDGQGTCKGTSTCTAGYSCTAGLCNEFCATDSQCADGYTCAADKTCKRSTGQQCATPSECASGNCVDGYCCGAASCSECSSCNVTGHQGTCYPVTNGASDGACVLACTGYQVAGPCDGSGNCKPATACPNGYLCSSSTQCATSCTLSCAPGYYCDGNSCLVQKATGQQCTAAEECATGNCVDGYCCGDPSCTECKSCNVAQHLGSCYPVPDGNADGNCGASCTGYQYGGFCDGLGACKPDATPCPNGNMCGSGGQCGTDCSLTGCAPNFYCSGTTCAPLKADGQQCESGAECSHGVCVSDGTTTSICCSTACPDVICQTKPLCNPGGSGCQTYAEGEVCATGYVCVGGTCPGPGGCTPPYTGCDTANGYTCNDATSSCEIQSI